jgi:hypothetical protein
MTKRIKKRDTLYTNFDDSKNKSHKSTADS